MRDGKKCLTFRYLHAEGNIDSMGNKRRSPPQPVDSTVDWGSKLGHEGARQGYDKQEPQQVASLDSAADSREIGSTDL